MGHWELFGLRDSYVAVVEMVYAYAVRLAEKSLVSPMTLKFQSSQFQFRSWFSAISQFRNFADFTILRRGLSRIVASLISASDASIGLLQVLYSGQQVP